MNDVINNFNLKKLAPRDACLWKEWKELDSLCDKLIRGGIPQDVLKRFTSGGDGR